MPFSLTLQGNNQQKASAMKPTEGEIWKKSIFSMCCFNKNNHVLWQRQIKKWLCHRKWLTLFSLKFQRITRKIPYPQLPPRGKPEKRLYFPPHCGDGKQPHTITEPKKYILKKSPKKRTSRLLVPTTKKAGSSPALHNAIKTLASSPPSRNGLWSGFWAGRLHPLFSPRPKRAHHYPL